MSTVFLSFFVVVLVNVCGVMCSNVPCIVCIVSKYQKYQGGWLHSMYSLNTDDTFLAFFVVCI